MGIAIQYCIFCQEQIPSKDVTEGKAIQRPGGYVCIACAKKAGLQAEEPAPAKHLTPSPRRLSASSVPGVRTSAHPTPPPMRLAGHPTPPPASRDPHASHAPHASHVPHASHASHVPPRRSPTPIVLGGIGLVIGILLLVISVNRGSDAPKTTTPTSTEPPPDPRVSQIKSALANAKEIDPGRFDEAIAAFRDAAKVLPGSSWAREADAEAKKIEAARDAEASAAFDRLKEEADNWEKDGGFAGALEEWGRYPMGLRGGEWGARVDAEKKAIEERRMAFEKEAEALARDVLRKAATHADAKEYDKAIQALETYPARFKATKWATEVAQAKSRYQESTGTAPKPAPAEFDSAEAKCIEALVAGDVTAARKAWEALLGGSLASKAKIEIEDLADIETDREREGLALYVSRNHIVALPKGAAAWKRSAKGVIRVAAAADLEEDGKQEVFIGLDGSHEDPGFLFCMALDGSKRWQFGTGAIHWNQPGATDKLNVSGLKVVDLDGDGKKEVISVSNHVQLFPCRVCVLSSEGKLLSEYWHPGHGGEPLAGDLDGDGKPRVLISFVNKDLNMTQVIACFKGTDIRGTAPPHGTDGSQVWYTEVPGAKPPMRRITWRRETNDGPVTKIECEFQDGVWVLGPDGKVIQKP